MRTARAALRFRPMCLGAGLAAAILLAGVAATTALACPVCMPPVRATIAGPGLRGTISIGDTAALAGIVTATLPGFDPRAPIASPTNLRQGYEVVRYYQPIGGQTPAPNPSPAAYDRFLYYPAAPSRTAVYLYEGPIAQDSQVMPQVLTLDEMAGKWYTANQTEAAAMQALLAAARAPHPTTTAAPASPAGAHSQPQTAPVWWQRTSWLPVATMLAGLALLAGALILLRRQRVHAIPARELQLEREETPARQ